jgi:hypothetical protein
MDVMSLVTVAWPQSESDLSVMLCTLEAHGIKAFVQGGGIGSLYPGPQVPFFNARQVMVPSEDADKARKALAVLTQPVAKDTYRWPGFLHMLRMLVEFVTFGWFVPCEPRRRIAKSMSDNSSRPEHDRHA